MKNENNNTAESTGEEATNERLYQINFDGNVLTHIRVNNGNLEIVGAINGYGNAINLTDIKIEEIKKP